MDQQQLDKHIDELYEIILQLKDKEECRAFFEDLCTFKEIEQMALRAYAAKLCLNGKTYTEMITKTELSSATISRVARCVNRGAGGYKQVFGDKQESFKDDKGE